MNKPVLRFGAAQYIRNSPLIFKNRSSLVATRPITFTNGSSHRQFTILTQASQAQSDPSTQEPPLDLDLPRNCSGCGVNLQQQDPNGPGFFQVPQKLLERLRRLEAGLLDEDEDLPDEENNTNEAEEEEKFKEFDDLVLSWLIDGEDDKNNRPEVHSFDYEETSEIDVLCARCYSLKHYGRVKSEAAEAALPGFDFKKVVGQRLKLQKFRRSVVLVVVDLADFDGSLPRAAVRSLLSPQQLDSSNVSDHLPRGFRLVIAVNKSDLLPSQASLQRVESWVRRRMNQGGLPRPSAVHIVSSLKRSGVRTLLADLQAAAGTRGDVWVIGAQNAGKSSLINAMRAEVGLAADKKHNKEVTTSPIAGTTLGVVQVPGLLPKGCKMLDTPGVPHEYQLATYLTAEEMKMVLPKRQLKPRTYRLAAGQTVSLGGLARVDVVSSPGATMYLTVWVSDEVRCHMGRTDTAEERYARHAGSMLCPPVGDETRMAEFPALVPVDVKVNGDSWKGSSGDIAIAGLGWVAVGVSGQAELKVWSPPGVAITTRDALIPDFAKEMERPGFGDAKSEVGKPPSAKKKGGGGGGKRKK